MKLGVIIGRFQVAELHEGHVELIKKVSKEHDRVLILLGVSSALGTKRNPLDYATRERMLRNHHYDLLISPLPDMVTDEAWSKNLDSLVRQHCPIGEVKLYAGRDSFVPHYKGMFPVYELDISSNASGSEQRLLISDIPMNDDKFRAGIIYSAYNQYNKLLATVDALVVAHETHQDRLDDSNDSDYYLLLGKKKNEPYWRLPGGFVDICDSSLEGAVVRELYEETGLDISDSKFKYLRSSHVHDWRYKDPYSEGKILTSFFKCNIMGRQPIKASDDLDELVWINLKDLTEDYPLFQGHEEAIRYIRKYHKE